jgi:hypothetical protein
VAASDWRIPLRPDRLLSRRILCDLDGLDLSKPIRLVIYPCLPIQIQRAEVKRRGQLTGVRVTACRRRRAAREVYEGDVTDGPGGDGEADEA